MLQQSSFSLFAISYSSFRAYRFPPPSKAEYWSLVRIARNISIFLKIMLVDRSMLKHNCSFSKGKKKWSQSHFVIKQHLYDLLQGEEVLCRIYEMLHYSSPSRAIKFVAIKSIKRLLYTYWKNQWSTQFGDAMMF